MDQLAQLARDTCRRFNLAFEPLRPELYRYCRHLTRSPWDAEDLAQDTMARALVTLGTMLKPAIENPRAWLFRVATNLYIDHVRRAREELGERTEEPAQTSDQRAKREAAGTLIARLAPQERAAVVLKDAFDLELGDIATVLGTTVGAVKAALHRGRGKLTDPRADDARVPAPAALDAFCRAFDAGDLPALTALLLDTVTVEMPGCAVDLGLAATTDPRSGILYHTLLSPLFAGMPRRYLEGYDGTEPAGTPPRRGRHPALVRARFGRSRPLHHSQRAPRVTHHAPPDLLLLAGAPGGGRRRAGGPGQNERPRPGPRGSGMMVRASRRACL
jgi:RNA polymerase sigma-70 factor (ECF subfamily)